MKHIRLVETAASSVYRDEREELEDHLVRILEPAAVHAMTRTKLSWRRQKSKFHLQVQDIVQNWKIVRIEGGDT